MSMERFTLRLPSGTLRAYRQADGNTSKVMRRRLTEAVEDGEVDGVSDDLMALAAVESTVDHGALDRRRGTYRKRVAEFYAEKWGSGYVTPDDAESMADSWRREAAVYGAEYVAFCEAVVGWYVENWEPTDSVRPDWPDPGTFHVRADPEVVDVEQRLVDVMREARDEGLGRSEAVAAVSRFHEDAHVEAAAGEVYADGGRSE